VVRKGIPSVALFDCRDLRKIINERKKAKSLLSLLVPTASIPLENAATDSVKPRKSPNTNRTERINNDDPLYCLLDFQFDSDSILSALWQSFWNLSAVSIKQK
jgi:hypothetical protein